LPAPLLYLSSLLVRTKRKRLSVGSKNPRDSLHSGSLQVDKSASNNVPCHVTSTATFAKHEFKMHVSARSSSVSDDVTRNTSHNYTVPGVSCATIRISDRCCCRDLFVVGAAADVVIAVDDSSIESRRTVGYSG
jgi:hypothetical protein